ncbi:526_t:CDS:2, partial [Racocetra fulgida]
NLALSRALGDFEFKQNPKLKADEQIVTAYPDVKRVEIIPDSTEFLVLAFIRKNLSEHKDLRKACEDLMERCLAKDSELGGIGCDNMTVIVVGFLHKRSEKDWYEWMAKRYGEKGPEYPQDDARPPKEEHSLNGGDNIDEDMGLTPEPNEELTLDNTRVDSNESIKSTDSNRSDSVDSISSDSSSNPGTPSIEGYRSPPPNTAQPRGPDTASRSKPPTSS